MSTKIEFQVVPDEYRETLPPIERSSRSPIFQSLVKGETLFIPITEDMKDTALNRFYEKARSVSKKLNRRKTMLDDVTGYLLWFSDTETE